MKNDLEMQFSSVLLLAHFCFVGAQTDYAPYFYDNGPNSNNGNMALLNLSEDTPKGTQIYVLNGTDPEGQPVKYGMTSEPGSKEYFRVHPKSGTVTLIEELDREAQDEIEVFVSISDGLNKVAEKVSVFVMDANDERPQFPQNMPSIVDVPENTTSGSSIYKVQAVDRDAGSGGSVTYFLQSSEPSTKFAIDHHSGVLRIKPGETLDYEKSRTHFITVVAKDGGGIYKGKQQVMSSSATLTINVIDAQDTPPVFVGTPYFGYVYEVSSPGSEIFTVFAKDGDMDNPNPIIYSIESANSQPIDSGADGVFAINKTSGCITLKVYPAELKREIFNIKVKASEVSPEGKRLDFAVTTVTIRVVDLNNHPPTFFGENGPQNVFELTMYEHPPEGEFLRGLKITVNDSDQGSNAKFHLRLVGPGRMLRVVPQTVLNEAQVTVLVEDSAAMDFEKSQFLTFKLLAIEIDTPERFSATADIIIHLLDTNDNAPKFSSDFYIARIPENSPGGSSVVSVTATDPDSGLWGVVKYSIYGSGADLFLIQPDSGIIYTQPWASLDAEVKSKYNFYVKAEDSDGKYSLAEVFVTIMDLNDHSPAFNENSLEKTMVIGAPVKIEAVDEDAEEPNNVIEYSIMKSDPDDIFDMDADTGEIKLKPYIKSMDIVQNISNHKDCTWSVVVQAKDRGSPSFSTTTVVKIDITEATQLKGPLTSFLLKCRENPMQFLGLVSGVIIIMLFVTVFISTVIYVRNVKSNKILPSRRIIRRKRKPRRQDDFQQPFREECCGGKFRNEDLEIPTADNINRNNNVKGCSHRAPPSPPNAPDMPPPLPSHYRHGDREWTVPTVSASVASKTKKRSHRGKDNPVNTALVSELKLRLEQKNMANRY
ncbi:cadherin-related family member 1 isoform X1 [Sinocyclocheilus grahami]|uniref:cadherin-related family member 1 isoform X1 n=1 Tax=Sinocyclocheilus grahami TaxID=75366 RepID=UPI0007AD5A5A|nr:PREDICTED: cadherin-related family member 1 isoform X1 [Sinocyclocheilus grahami]